jgi:CheY-like chemotaxis protein
MRYNLLLVEDNGHKRDRIVGFLFESFPHWDVVQSNSFTEGSRAVLERSFHVILMDMSLPTYAKKGNESGGRFRTFGGREIARKALRKDGKVRILFVTQYEAFSDQGSSKSFESIDSELRIECGNQYAGLVHFDSSKTIWKEQISKLLLEVANENTDS